MAWPPLPRALQPAPRPILWALLASLGAGWFAQSFLVAIVQAASASLFDARPTYTLAFGLGAAVAAFVARASGGWRAALVLIALGFVIQAVASILLALFPACAPSEVCTPAAPGSAFIENWPTDVAIVAGALLAQPMPPGPPRRWGVLEGLGAFAVVGSFTGLGLMTPISISLMAVGLAASAIGAAVAGLVIARRAERPVRDAIVVAAVQLLAFAPAEIAALGVIPQFPTLVPDILAGFAIQVAAAVAIVLFAALFRRVIPRAA